MKTLAALVLAFAAASAQANSFLARLDLALLFEDLDPNDAYASPTGWGTNFARADLAYGATGGEVALGQRPVEVVSPGQTVATDGTAPGVALRSSVLAGQFGTTLEVEGRVTAASTIYHAHARRYTTTSGPTLGIAIAPNTRMSFSGTATAELNSSNQGQATASLTAYAQVRSPGTPGALLWSDSFSDGMLVEDGMSGEGNWAFDFTYTNDTGMWQYADLTATIGASGMSSPVPEPASALLVGAGALALAVVRRRRAHASARAPSDAGPVRAGATPFAG